MKMGVKQKKIYQFLTGKEVVKKSDVVDEFCCWYYQCRTDIASRYIGQILSSMVKSGYITRVRQGHYKQGGSKMRGVTDPNQLNMF